MHPVAPPPAPAGTWSDAAVRGAPGWRPRAVRVALAGASVLAAAVLVVAPDRLPSWRWTVGGVTTELGPGRRVVDLSEAGSAPTSAAQSAAGRRGRHGALDSAGGATDGGVSNSGLNSGGTRRTFSTYQDAEDYAAKAAMHVLLASWLPDGYALESVGVTLSQLPPEAVIALGLPQRVAITQRFVAPDGSINVVQSQPPPLFDLLFEPGQDDDALELASGAYAQLGLYPQGVIVFWRQRDGSGSVAIIGDPGAAARLTRADWQRLADSLT